MLALWLLTLTTYAPTDYHHDFGNARVRYKSTSNPSVQPTDSYVDGIPTLTFPDDPNLSYSGDVTVEEIPEQNKLLRFAFRLNIRVRNASAATSLNDGPGIGGRGLAITTFPETTVIHIDVTGQRYPGNPLASTFDIIDSAALQKDSCFFFQRFAMGEDCSVQRPFFTSAGAKIDPSAVLGFQDRDFPAGTTQPGERPDNSGE